MNQTINISLPKTLNKLAKQQVKAGYFSSVSEVIRDSLRKTLITDKQNQLTVNGFTKEFEDQILEAAKEPIDKSETWETEEDIEKFFNSLR